MAEFKNVLEKLSESIFTGKTATAKIDSGNLIIHVARDEDSFYLTVYEIEEDYEEAYMNDEMFYELLLRSTPVVVLEFGINSFSLTNIQSLLESLDKLRDAIELEVK